MRADESFVKRHNDKVLLSEFLDRLPVGTFVAIGAWYAKMDELGLRHSHRQRLSELRKEGYICIYSKKLGGYVYQGQQVNGSATQSELFCYAQGGRCAVL